MMCRSVRHTPAPPILTITSSGPVMTGSGTSSITGAEWNLCSLTAFTRPPDGVRSWNLGSRLWVAGFEHAGADARVGVDAGAREAGATQVDGNGVRGDWGARRWV